MKPILYENALFHTGVTEAEVFDYMLVKNGKIAALTNERPKCGKYSKAVDLGGGHAYPCLIDPHVHLLESIASAALGFNICRIESGGVVPNTINGIERKLREYCAGRKRGELVIATNYIMSALDEPRLPTRAELDEWCGGRPVVIYTIDGHASALSSAMLKKIGISPEGHSGVLSGEEHDRNQGRLTDAVSSAITLPVLARGIANIENSCAEYGISCVGALEGKGDSKRDIPTILMLHLARHMPLNVRMYFQYFDIDRALKLSRYQRRPRIGGCGDWEMDGAVGAHSAAMSVPYKDNGVSAGCYYPQELVNETVRRADELGFQVSSHAIGDLAVKRITEALYRVKSKTFHRVEHGEFQTPETVERFKNGNYACVMQPGYSWIDKRFLHSYERYLEPRAIDMLVFGSLYRAGVCVCGSSDSPVQSLDPYLQMTGMADFYIPEESVSVYEAFRCYTINPARALGEEDETGSLEQGKAADFFVADESLFELAPEGLSLFRPREVYYRGKKWEKRRGTVGELIRMMLTRAHKV